jgi:hypothetical protein
MMATLIYVLCALTSLACAALLLRAHRRSGARLLFWAGLCFVGLFLNNLLLVVAIPGVSTETLETWRSLPAVAGVALLVYGLVWESAS